METYKVNPLEVRGVDYDVYVDEAGRFQTSFNGQTYTSGTREDLYKRLVVATKKKAAKISVPFSVDRFGKLVHGVATGIHASRGDVLVKWDDGQREAVSLYKTLQRLTPEESTEYERLHKAVKDAEQALYEFTKPRTLSLHQAVNKALEEAIKES